jgi:hypothetical protein
MHPGNEKKQVASRTRELTAMWFLGAEKRDALLVRAVSAATTGSPLQGSTPPISPAAMTASSALRTLWEHSEQSSDFAFSSASPNAIQALNPAG